MASSKMWFFCFAVSISGGLYPTLTEGERMTGSLKVSASVSKSTLRAGDSIRITGVIKNTSANPIFFLARPKIYPILHIKMVDANGMELRGFRKLLYGLGPFSARDFVKIGPGGETTMSFEATLVQGSVLDVEKGGQSFVRGLFLDFGNSAILIPEKGRFGLFFQIAEFEQPIEEARQQFGFDNVWHGKEVSSPVVVQICAR